MNWRSLVAGLLLLSFLPLFAQDGQPSPALSPVEQTLLVQHQQLWKIWAISRNYQHGTTVAKDELMAYAWLKLYVQALPSGYPNLQQHLNQLKTQLTAEQLAAVDSQVVDLRNKYAIDFRFTEADLLTIFAIREKTALDEPEHHSSIVGYFDLNKIKRADINIVLQRLPPTGELTEDPWEALLEPVTVMPDGQFYAENLSTARYHIRTSSHGRILQSIDINLHPGQRHNLGELIT